MKVTVPKRQFVDALKLVDSVIPTRSSNPALSLLKLTGGGDILTLSGQNQEMSLSAEVAGDLDGDPVCVYVPSFEFTRVAKAAGELIALDIQDNKITLKSGGYKANVMLAAEGWGELDDFAVDTEQQAIAADDLLSALTNSAYACAKAEYQAAFRNLYFDDGAVVATDGFRLAKVKADVTGGFMLTSRHVDMLVKVLKGRSATAQFFVGSQGFRLELPALTFQARLAEGNYPDYKRVIPTEFMREFTANAAEFVRELERVTLMADREANSRVDLSLWSDGLKLSAESQAGNAESDVELDNVTGDLPFEFAVNADFLIQALKRCQADVRVRLTTATKPFIIEPTNSADPYMALVVPLHT